MAIALTVFTCLWIVFVIFIASKIELVLALYEIAATITFDQPLVLVISIVVNKNLFYINI